MNDVADGSDAAASTYVQPSMLQTYVFSPVCLFMCDLRWLDRAARYSQPSHEQMYGFSPVWIRRCTPSVPKSPDRNAQPCQSHAYGFSPMWDARVWRLRTLVSSQRKLQPTHVQAYRPPGLCVAMYGPTGA